VYRYTTEEPAPPFVRDAPTVLSYAALISYAFWLYAFGPALALLQHQLHFSYTVLGGYSVLWSGGAALAGAVFTLATRHLRRGPLLWCSALLAGAGAALFTLTDTIALTLAGAGLLGFAGTTLLTVTQAIMSDQHGRQRDRALTEANVGAAACAVLAPLLLGPLAATAAGWRAAFALPAIALVGLYLRFGRQPLPPAPTRDRPHGPARLPAACWLFAVLVAAGIAVEFCLIYFGAEFLATTGLGTTAAATAVSSYYLGILLGRILGAIMTRRPGRSVILLHGSLWVTLFGFLLFWLTGRPTVAVLGLFVCGLGIANLYPLSLALTLGAAAGHEDKANSRTQLVGGLMVIAAPYLLGALADHVGLGAAFAIEPALIVASALLLVTGLRSERSARHPAPALNLQ
jgi:MFS family permease